MILAFGVLLFLFGVGLFFAYDLDVKFTAWRERRDDEKLEG